MEGTPKACVLPCLSKGRKERAFGYLIYVVKQLHTNHFPQSKLNRHLQTTHRSSSSSQRNETDKPHLAPCIIGREYYFLQRIRLCSPVENRTLKIAIWHNLIVHRFKRLIDSRSMSDLGNKTEASTNKQLLSYLAPPHPLRSWRRSRIPIPIVWRQRFGFLFQSFMQTVYMHAPKYLQTKKNITFFLFDIFPPRDFNHGCWHLPKLPKKVRGSDGSLGLLQFWANSLHTIFLIIQLCLFF